MSAYYNTVLAKFGQSYRILYLHNPVAREPKGSMRDPLEKSTPDTKLDNNFVRARSRVKELALCNDWQYFFTFTLDESKYDRYDLKPFQRDLSRFIRNFSRRLEAPVKYLLIPEQHKDGAWHMHGLIMGLPKRFLTPNSNGYQEWADYSKRFGFCSVDPIRDRTKCASYISKYISKQMAQRAEAKGEHLFYCSQKLSGMEIISRGILAQTPTDFEEWYSGDWCKVKWLESEPEHHEFDGKVFFPEL